MKEGKIRILLITNYFPPLRSVASLRMESFVRHIPSDKAEFKVITYTPEKKSLVYTIHSAEVTAIPNKQIFKLAGFEKPSPYLIHKLKALWNRILLGVGIREMQGWENEVTKTVERLTTQWMPDVVITSHPFESSLEAGLLLKKKHPKVKWIIDLRDALSTNPRIQNIKRTYFRSREKEYLKYADALITVSGPILNYFKSLNGWNIPMLEIRNGYDFTPGNSGLFNDVFTIAYTGTFYADIKPDLFLKVVSDLISQGIMEDVRINFYGTGNSVLIPENLKKKTVMTGKIDYSEAVEKMKNSDALLLVLPGLEFKGVYSGKVFDYIATGRTIIALVDKEDVAAELISEAGTGFLADPASAEETKDAVLKAYRLWQERKLLPFREEWVRSLHRSCQTEKLWKVIISLCSE